MKSITYFVPCDRFPFRRSAYLSALLRLLTVDQLKTSAANPSAYMTRTHIMLHYVAMRRMGVTPCAA